MFSSLDSALTGPLLATPAMRACFSDGSKLQAMLRAEAALARAEAAHGLAPELLAPAIEVINPAQLDPSAIGKATSFSGVPTIPFVKAVQALLPKDLERSFHKGATTQDILDTAMALQCQQAFALLAQDLPPILGAFSTLAQTHRTTPCVGRTYGQHAAPVTFGFKVAVWLAGIADAAERLPEIRSRLGIVSLGGPVGTLSGLAAAGPDVLDSMGEALDLATTPITWHARRGRIAEAACWLATLIGALAKMATDIAHLCSTEVAEVAEPYIPGRGGSSAMPHKRNPVSCTVILAAHAAAPAHAATLLGAMAAAHERPVGLWHAEWSALPELFGLASGALHEARTLAEGLEVDPARMHDNLGLTRGLLFADAAAARLANSLGREAAHQLVEQAAAEVRRTGETLAAILARDPAVTVDLSPAFDLGPAVASAGPWVDRAIQHAERVRNYVRERMTPCR